MILVASVSTSDWKLKTHPTIFISFYSSICISIRMYIYRTPPPPGEKKGKFLNSFPILYTKKYLYKSIRSAQTYIACRKKGGWFFEKIYTPGHQSLFKVKDYLWLFLINKFLKLPLLLINIKLISLIYIFYNLTKQRRKL